MYSDPGNEGAGTTEIATSSIYRATSIQRLANAELSVMGIKMMPSGVHKVSPGVSSKL